MSFVQDCIQDSLPIWASCLEMPFLTGIADGSLPEACFQGYLVDDSLYLREYAKVFAWGMIHSQDMAEIRNYYSLLAFVNEAEDATRRYYLRRYQITDEEIQPLPLRPENQAYVDCMLEAAAQPDAGAAECMMACLPCMLSYRWIFGELLQRHPGVRETPYWPFVRDYAGERYDTVCAAWIDFAERACAELSEQRRQRCRELFRACSLHECQFWAMSARPREDLNL